MASFRKLARVEDVPPGRTYFVDLAGGPVLLANYEGAVYAVSGICMHQFCPLNGAALWGPLIDCPWHHFQYDCRTGENHYPRNVYPSDIPRLQQQLKPLRSYAVELREGDIWVNLE